jgi:xanthine dehydrogenase molybdopterin-binding subunit B
MIWFTIETGRIRQTGSGCSRQGLRLNLLNFGTRRVEIGAESLNFGTRRVEISAESLNFNTLVLKLLLELLYKKEQGSLISHSVRKKKRGKKNSFWSGGSGSSENSGLRVRNSFNGCYH